MNETELKQFEELADVIASPPNNETYKKANEHLNAFTSDLENWDKIQSVLDMSK